MTRHLKTVIVILAVFSAFYILSGAAAEARQGILATTQGSFSPLSEMAPNGMPPAGPAPTSDDRDLKPQPPTAKTGDKPQIYTGEKITLEFKNADIRDVFKAIGEISGKSIVVPDTVNAKMTTKIKDMPWDQALDMVLSARHLGVCESGDTLTVYDLPKLPSCCIRHPPATTGSPAYVSQLIKKVFTPKYAPISKVKEELAKFKSERGKVVVIGNDIYVEDEPGAMSTMMQIFLRTDRATRQILIEARIVEATPAFIEKLGVQWRYGGSTGLAAPAPGGASQEMFREAAGAPDSTGNAQLDFGFLKEAEALLLLNATISAPETSGEARTISAPRIMAANDREISIKHGWNVGGDCSGVSATAACDPQFKEIVMELKATPHIDETGRAVSLGIALTSDSSGASPAVNTATDIIKNAAAKLMMTEGETLVIGGIVTDTGHDSTGRATAWRRSPLLDWALGAHLRKKTQTEMLIFITPRIIPVDL